MICLFLGYFWKTENALLEMEDGNEGVSTSKFGTIWTIFIKYISPILIGIVLISTIWRLLS